MKLANFLFILSSWWPAICAAEQPVRRVSYQGDVRPILSKHCFACHGFDKSARQADLRLDTQEGATADRDGIFAIVPGRPELSEMIRRIESTDPDVVMPPPELENPLDDREQEVLRLWIEQGARYEPHWAFSPLMKPLPPAVSGIDHPVDAFVAARLNEDGLQLAPAAAPARLLRRVTLDLTGLPPTLEDYAAFQAELDRPGANPGACYERVVDRLLASPHFGEHLAVGWLDAARYADSNGYFSDKPRQMWLWRDWVIDAFNADMPFDQFTVEQLAGDLLPEPTVSQRIATGFNRNHMANNESGIIDEEYRVEYVVDRVHTTMTSWLGLTAGCAQCHDHKYDPISQRDFYQLFAFFNNVPETGVIKVDNPPPLISVPTAEQSHQLETLASQSRELTEEFATPRKQIEQIIADSPLTPAASPELAATNPQRIVHVPFDGGLSSQIRTLGDALPFQEGLLGQAADYDGTQHVEADLPSFSPDQPWAIAFWCKYSGSLSCPLSKVEPEGDRRGIELLIKKGALRVHLIHRWGLDAIEVSTLQRLSGGNWHHVAVSYDGSKAATGLSIYFDGEKSKLQVHRDTLTGTTVSSEPFRIGRRDSGLGYYGQLDELRILQQAVNSGSMQNWYWNERIHSILAVPADQRKPADAETLIDYFLSGGGQAPFAAIAENQLNLDETRKIRQRLLAAQHSEKQLRGAIPTVLVMEEMDQPRTANVLLRGEYNKPGEVVTPGVPTVIAPWPAGEPLNRLGFARWLVSRQNPVTPRVAVNRMWQHCFGAGLVRTVDDFGSQGELPTHPELLDWLAASFRDEGWDVKRLLKKIVTSKTYQQDSRFQLADGRVVDPENRLLARGPSTRLSAEMLRDQALALSGLLAPGIGGPSVKSYQPPGLWEEVSFDAEDVYVPDAGEALWRRSLYSFIKRQVPPPWLLTFDGPTREKCTLRRSSTNTPLQSLVLLNDDTFVEAARALATRILDSADPEDVRLNLLWRTVLIRPADAGELELLRGLLKRQREHFAVRPEAARLLLSIGASPVDSKHPPLELAAWTVVAQAILNLDEVITKR